jgi:hypothetical protein
MLVAMAGIGTVLRRESEPAPVVAPAPATRRAPVTSAC